MINSLSTMEGGAPRKIKRKGEKRESCWDKERTSGLDQNPFVRPIDRFETIYLSIRYGTGRLLLHLLTPSCVCHCS